MCDAAVSCQCLVRVSVRYVQVFASLDMMAMLRMSPVRVGWMAAVWQAVQHRPLRASGRNLRRRTGQQ